MDLLMSSLMLEINSSRVVALAIAFKRLPPSSLHTLNRSLMILTHSSGQVLHFHKSSNELVSVDQCCFRVKKPKKKQTSKHLVSCRVPSCSWRRFAPLIPEHLRLSTETRSDETFRSAWGLRGDESVQAWRLNWIKSRALGSIGVYIEIAFITLSGR